MRPRAEIDEGVVDRVARDDRPPFLLEQLNLERLATLGEVRLGLLLRQHLALVRQVLRSKLAHFVLDRHEVLRDERSVDDEVVEEALIGRRADAALGPGEQAGHGRRHQMGGAVPIQVQRLWRLGGNDLQRGIHFERIRQVDHLFVDERRQGLLRQTQRDPFGDVPDGGACRHALGGAIRQRNGHLAHAVLAAGNVNGLKKVRGSMVGTGGLEPPTSCMSSRRSNQLSYAPIS